MSRLHPATAHWDDAGPALGRPLAAEAFRPETAVLAAITSRYEDARARIIASPPPSSPPPSSPPPSPQPSSRPREPAPVAVAPPGWAPTVPVDLASWRPQTPEHEPRPLTAAPSPVSGGRWRGVLRRRPR